MKKKRTRKTDRWGEEDINPMEGVANLADVMLCLAVGIMLALITHWNVDINFTGTTRAQGVQGSENATEIGESQLNKVDQDKVNINELGEGYQHIGRVYKDPESGKIYIVTEE